jgi:hypothetical protein
MTTQAVTRLAEAAHARYGFNDLVARLRAVAQDIELLLPAVA